MHGLLLDILRGMVPQFDPRVDQQDKQWDGAQKDNRQQARAQAEESLNVQLVYPGGLTGIRPLVETEGGELPSGLSDENLRRYW